MAQTPAVRVAEGTKIDYTPGSAVTAGQVVVIGSVPLVAFTDIPASTLGSLEVEGIFDVPKVTGAITAGDAIYWDTDADPVVGTAGTGAATGTATANYLMGFATIAAASGDTYVRVKLTSARRTATIAGSVTADDITGTDSALAIAGLGAAQGGSIGIVGGTSSTSGNAGGAITVTGGTPGATGAGGAVTIAGAAGGATSGTGGAVSIAGGAGTAGNANGGAVTINGGNAHGSGTDGAIAIGSANTASVTFGVMPRIPTATVAAAGTNQGTAAAITEGFTLVSGADDTKGVILPSAVAGMICIVKVGDGADLKVYPNTSDVINGLSANAAITVVDDVCFMFIAYDATTWYTLPLLPS